jgi:gliding motility-associated-like protein
VNEKFNVNITNVLTPNGDGINDTWKIENIETINQSVVQVFDRNGVEVFYSKEYNNDWQGIRGSDILPDGTYYYLVTSESSNALFRGALTIIRNNKD